MSSYTESRGTTTGMGNYNSLISSYTTNPSGIPVPSTTVVGQQIVPTFGGPASYSALQMHKGGWAGPYAQFSDYPKPNWRFVSRTCGGGDAGGSN